MAKFGEINGWFNHLVHTATLYVCVCVGLYVSVCFGFYGCVVLCRGVCACAWCVRACARARACTVLFVSMFVCVCVCVCVVLLVCVVSVGENILAQKIRCRD